MTARDFTELACWQLSTELKARIYALIARPKVAKDSKYCDQIREAARSAPSNIAEGFGKYYPAEFRRYLNIAAGSLREIQDRLRDGLMQNYVDGSEFKILWSLSRRARSAALALMEYLEKCPRNGPPRRTARQAKQTDPNQGGPNRKSR